MLSTLDYTIFAIYLAASSSQIKKILSSEVTIHQVKEGKYCIRTIQTLYGDKVILFEPVQGKYDIHSILSSFGLSKRQAEVASMVIGGHSNHEIAERLHIMEQTVKDHLCSIYEKLGIRRRGELTAKVLGLRQAPFDFSIG